MKKIPTVWQRDPDDRSRVLPDVTPGCEWVLDGEGTATRKYDGTCVMLDADGAWWARREVKPGRPTPAGYVPLATDENTGKTVGWEPISGSPFAKFHAEALEGEEWGLRPRVAGTYELCGPKVNKNPESYPFHRLVPHAHAQRLDAPREYEALRTYLFNVPFEGVVWHHPDGRMAKIKRRDFG